MYHDFWRIIIYEFCVTFVLVLHIARIGLLLRLFKTRDVLRDKTRKNMVV